MTVFYQVPSESKSQINRAGQILTQENPNPFEYEQAKELANRWRACHGYPINTFQATLRIKLNKYPAASFVAQRLKRMPTIIDKLKRYPAMKLTTMQDIGGIRAVVPSVREVYKLYHDYKNNPRLTHELIDEKDYIAGPRSEDGYRSVHLIYKYNNVLAPEYNGLRLELQIRTKLQHVWATAVETMGTFLGQALKSRQGDQAWLDFFSLVSSAFSYMEGTAQIPRFRSLTQRKTCIEIKKIEASIRAIEKMRGFTTAVNMISSNRGRGKGSSYHLVVLDSINRTVAIHAYDRNSLGRAVEDYSRFESEAAGGATIEPVLVSAGPIDSLRKAYPNFFLDIGEFLKIVEKLISNAKRH